MNPQEQERHMAAVTVVVIMQCNVTPLESNPFPLFAGLPPLSRLGCSEFLVCDVGIVPTGR